MHARVYVTQRERQSRSRDRAAQRIQSLGVRRLHATHVTLEVPFRDEGREHPLLENGWMQIGGQAIQSSVEAGVETSCAAIRDDISSLVKALTEKLFFNFGYYQLPDTGDRGYRNLIERRLKEWL